MPTPPVHGSPVKYTDEHHSRGAGGPALRHVLSLPLCLLAGGRGFGGYPRPQGILESLDGRVPVARMAECSTGPLQTCVGLSCKRDMNLYVTY